MAFLLLEDGSYLLLESGGRFLLQDTITPQPPSFEIDTNLVLYNNAGQRIGNLVEARSIQYGYRDSAFYPLTFSYNFNDIDTNLRDNLIYGSEVRVQREGRVVWAGEIQKITKRAIVGGTERLKTVEFLCRHWGEVFLTTRYVTDTYTSIDETTIAANVITNINNNLKSGAITASQANTGISIVATELSGNIRTRVYDQDQALTILQQLVAVRDIGGLNRYRGFRVTPDFRHEELREFRYEPTYGIVISAFEVRGAVIDNITQLNPDMKDYYNGLITQGNNLEVTNITSNQSELDTFKYREGYNTAYNVTDTDTLNQIGAQQLSDILLKQPVYQVSLSANNPYTGHFAIGDQIRLVFADSDLQIDLNQLFRVVEIVVNVDDMRVETTQIKILEMRADSKTFMTGAEKLINTGIDNSVDLVELNKT